jgi:membrane protease YdiL (CAAX protease family)
LTPPDGANGSSHPGGSPGADGDDGRRTSADASADPSALTDRPHATPADGAAEPPGPERARPGASTFTIEGRVAPALFVVGWLATLMGVGIVFVGVQSGGSGLSTALVTGGLALLSVGLIAAAGSQGIERRARARAAGATSGYHGPSPVLVFVAAIPLAILALIGVGIPLALLGIDIQGPLGRSISVGVQTVVYVILIRLLVVDTRALTWRDMGVVPPDRRTFGELAAGAVWAIPVIVATIPISLVLLAIFPVTPESPLPPTGETGGFILQLIAGAILAPVGEELFFRGFATTAWVRSLGLRRGLVRAALFFAFAHVLTISGASPGEAAALALIGFATRVPVALALGWLFVRRGNIWAPIGLHATFNAILLILGEVAVRTAS